MMLQDEKGTIFKQLQSEMLQTSFESIMELEDFLDENIFLIKNGEEPEIDINKILKFYKKYNLAIKESVNYWNHNN